MKRGHGHFDDVEIDRRQGIRLAAIVGKLVAQHGGTNDAAQEALGVSAGVLSRARRAKPLARFSPATIDAIARAAGLTRAELLDGKGAP